MSVTFYGQRPDDSAVMLHCEDDSDYLNLANGNAALFLDWLRLPLQEGFGECTVYEARRAIIRGRNTSRAVDYTREEISAGGPGTGHARYFQQGLYEEQLYSYLVRFERFVERAAKEGANRIYWG